METVETLEFLKMDLAKAFKSNGNETLQLKMDLLTAFGDIEKVIRGVFHSDLLFKGVEVEKLKTLFPNGCRLFKAVEQKDWYRIGHFFANIRDCCAHAKLSKRDFEVLHFCFKELDNEPKFNTQITYAKRGSLTVAGLIFLVLNFLRAESIKVLCKRSSLFSMVACGSNVHDDGIMFVERISGVNLEVPIRNKTGNSVFSSLLADAVDGDEGEFLLEYGSPKHPLFHVKGYIDESKVIINKGSLMSTYYLDDYSIDILDKEGFVELANKLPTLTLVDVLYAFGYRVFDKDAYNSMLSKWDLIQKLNYPKYYVDKNIRTLTLPETNADDRIVNKLTNTGLSRVFLIFEDQLFKMYGEEKFAYSKLSALLHIAGAPDEIVDGVTTLRNFVMHCSLFGTYNEYDEIIRQYSFDYAVDTIYELLKYLKDNNNPCYELLSKEIDEQFIKALIKLKYTQAIRASVQFVKKYPNYDDPSLSGANLSINHSCYDTESLNKIKELYDDEMELIIVTLPNVMEKLFFVYQDKNIENIKLFCKENNYNYSIVNGSIISKVTIQ